MKRQFWIDTDTASDDAVALMMALTHPGIDVVGISIVAGNVPLKQAVQNALYTTELCERRDVPVYTGADGPLRIPLETAQNVHGQDGMGDIGLPLAGRRPAGPNAVQRLIEASLSYPNAMTLVTLGPLTNLALALQADPGLADRLARTVVMGAVGDHIGNVSPVAEFNMWADPDAVDVVLRSGLDLEFVGWDISRHHAVITHTQAAAIRAIGTRRAEFAIDIQRIVAEFCANETGLAGFDLPDPIAMAIAIDPTIATRWGEYYCAVETQSPLTRGMVVMDVLDLLHRAPNARVVLAADNARFIDALRAAVS